MRVTTTNSGADSKGIVRFGNWEFEGNGYLYALGGALGSLFVFILTASYGYCARLTFAALPLGAALGWIKFFLVGRAPHFMGDFFEGQLLGKHFELKPQEWTKAAHPRGRRMRGTSPGVDQT
jgi:hypothetical protein